MSRPRKHHYCPESYLARFTSEMKRDGVLWVFDKDKREVRKSKPGNQATQRDFYRIEPDDGGDPFFMEKEFSKIEGAAADAIEHIHKTGQLPNTETNEYLLSFFGLLAVRTPHFRKKMGGFNEQFAKMLLDMTCSSEERFEASKEKLIREGKDVGEISYDEMRKFIDEDKYAVVTHQNDHLTTMLSAANTITNCLLPRNWVVIVAEDGDFVCSDNPVALNWSKSPPEPWLAPGFGVQNTEVTIPLSSKLALLGILEPLAVKTCALNKTGVALFNNKSIMQASRFVYGPSSDFIWRKRDGQIAGASDFFST